MNKTILDVRGAKCPVPIVKAKQALDRLPPGALLEVLSTDAGSVADFQGWAATSKVAVLEAQRTDSDDTGRAIYVHQLRRKD